MKPIKSILAGVIALAAFQTAADAATYTLTITGSTAFRPSTQKAICNVLTNPVAVYAKLTNGVIDAAGSVGLNNCDRSIITGTIGADTIIVKSSWSGAVGGVQTVSNGLAVTTLPESTLTSATAASGAGANASGGARITTGTLDSNVIPDVAMTDNYQISTNFNSTPLTDILVGIVPFKWIVSNPGTGNPAPFTNITTQQANNLFGAGSLSLAVFTGLAADEGVKVYAQGRDPDSGTRLSAFAETGFGVFSAANQKQALPLASDGTTPVTGYQPFPGGTVNGILVDDGDNGYFSGSALATSMGRPTDRTSGYSVTYVSTGDASTAIGLGAKELAYNGVTLGSNTDLVRNGQYTFWAYEHLMYKTTLDTNLKNVANIIANRIINNDATVLLSSMRVERATDGAKVTTKY